MILVILVLGILMAVGGTILYYKLDDDKDSIGTSLQITGAIIIMISAIASIILFISVVSKNFSGDGFCVISIYEKPLFFTMHKHDMHRHS